jgi:ElaB/YqjD/DUF883 family membrane-anchored ribosome-binding protein
MNHDPISSVADSDTARTAQQFAGQVRDQAQQVASQVRDQAQQVAGQVRDQAQEFAGQVREQAQRAIVEGGHYVRQNPWPTVLGAAGIGLLVGFALASRHEPTARERYVSDPLDHARDLLHSLIAPVAGRVQREYGHARSAIDDVADSLKDIDASKQANRLARKLRFW